MNATYSQGCEEPPVLSWCVTFLKQLLHCLLGILTLRHFFEGLCRNGALQTLELELVTGGEEVGVVDSLNYRESNSETIQKTYKTTKSTLMKGLTLLRFARVLAPMRFVTLRGYRSMPATTAWGYGRSFVPSSSCLITTTFLPAWRPWRTMATC